MGSNNQIEKADAMELGSVCRAHWVTVWFLFGGFLAYQAFFTSSNLSDFVTVGMLMGLGLLLFCLPFIVVVCGAYFIVLFVQNHENEGALICFGVMAAYFLLWRGVWWAMYGKHGRLARPIP